jgi:hypothetical protein
MWLLRSVVAIVAGFWFIAATVWVGILIATRILMLAEGYNGTIPGTLPAAYLGARLAVSALGSVMGGWLTARIASFAPFAHACVLAALLAAMSVNLFLEPPDFAQPGHQLWWYAAANAVIGPLAVLLGGRLRATAAGPSSGAPVTPAPR